MAGELERTPSLLWLPLSLWEHDLVIVFDGDGSWKAEDGRDATGA